MEDTNYFGLYFYSLHIETMFVSVFVTCVIATQTSGPWTARLSWHLGTFSNRELFRGMSEEFSVRKCTGSLLGGFSVWGYFFIEEFPGLI